MIIFKTKKHRTTDKDVFLAEKLKNADFNTGFYQVPKIHDVNIKKPKGLILWSNRKRCTNKSDYGLIFYEYDDQFDGRDGLYNVLKYGTDEEIGRLIDELKDFAFVVCPDYSVYGNFPNYKQIDAMARSREVGYILSNYGIKTIVNYRATFDWSYELALEGICSNGIVSIGSLGALQNKETRMLFKKSIIMLVKYVKPRLIIVYGYTPDDIFMIAKKKKIEIWQYDSEISKAFRGINHGNESIV